MAVIDQTPLSSYDDELLRRLDLDRRRTTASPSWSGPACVLLAALSAAAGAIHLAMVPAHAAEWLPVGLAFAASGWFQIGFAILILARPSRAALRASCVLNGTFIAAWVFTRIWGWPVGPEAGVPEGASFVDIACVLLESALVLVGYELLAKPKLGAKLGDGARVVLSIVPIGILLFGTAAIASPSAATHSHGGAAGADHDHDEVAAAGATGAAGAHDEAGHDHADAATTAAATPADDKGLSQIMNGSGEGGGHTHTVTNDPLDATTQKQLDAQLAQTRPFIDKYPTVKDAEAAGYLRQGPFNPGLGAHYTNAAGLGAAMPNGGGTAMTDALLAQPTLIYDGITPDSKLAGFMYNIFSLDTQTSPEGFAGPNDQWHYHTNVCLTIRPGGGVDAPLGADTSAPKELCDKYGGFLVANTGYMVHVWTVPGYDSPQGIFSNVNARIACPNGTYYIVKPEEIGTRSNTCKDVAS